MKPSGPTVVEIVSLREDTTAGDEIAEESELVALIKQAVLASGTGQYHKSTNEKYTVHIPQHGALFPR